MANSTLSLMGGRAGAKQRAQTVAPAKDVALAMWHEPYLETCCRSALHRLTLVGEPGRPDGLKDGPCLERLAGMGLARRRTGDGRFEITAEGEARHAVEILRKAG
jgi:hypothetical protein